MMILAPDITQRKITRPLILYLLAFVTLGAYHWSYLFSFPGWFVDEALTASRVHALASSGSPVGAIDRESTFGGESRALFVAAAPYLAFLLPHKLFPAMEIIESLRLTCYVAALLILASVGVIAWRYISPDYGAVALGICGASYIFSYSSHVARPDILATAVGFCGLALYGPRPLAAFMGFFLATFSLAFHQRGLILLVTLMAVMTTDIISRKISRSACLLAFAGMTLGLACFYFINIFLFSSLEAFISMTRRVLLFTPPPAMGSSAGDWWGIFSTLKMTSDVCYPTVGLFVFLSIVPLLFTRRTAVNPRLPVMIIVGLLAGALLINGMVLVKVVMVSPFLDLAMTGSLAMGISLAARNSRWRFAALAMSTWIITATCTRGIDSAITTPSACREESTRTAAFLQSLIPPSAKVIAEETYWIYLRNNRYQSWKDLPSRMQQTGQSLSEVMRSTNSDYLIVDDRLIMQLGSNLRDPFFRSLAVPQEDFAAFVGSFGSKVGELRTSCDSKLTVYALQKNMVSS